MNSDLMTAIRQRHSVRSYTTRPLAADVRQQLQQYIDTCNQESGLHIQLITDEPKAFDCMMAHYGKFSGVTNYIALIGKNQPDLQERCGYYGEKIVLYAQILGLNTCWVAMTYKKIPEAFQIQPGEKLLFVISLGYGQNQGIAHQSKPLSKVCQISDTTPDWFKKGVEAALLAPTAMNQQKFYFALEGNQVTAKAGLGFYSKADLGIVKYHFEIGAGTEHFQWKK